MVSNFSSFLYSGDPPAGMHSVTMTVITSMWASASSLCSCSFPWNCFPNWTQTFCSFLGSLLSARSLDRQFASLQLSTCPYHSLVPGYCLSPYPFNPCLTHLCVLWLPWRETQEHSHTKLPVLIGPWVFLLSLTFLHIFFQLISVSFYQFFQWFVGRFVNSPFGSVNLSFSF